MKTLIICFVLILNCFSAQEKTELETGWYHISEEETNFKRTLDKSEETFFIIPEKIVGLENFQDFMRISYFMLSNNQIPEILIQLDSLGAIKWETATKKAINQKLAFIHNDRLIYAPTIIAPIYGGQLSIWRESYEIEDLEKILEEMKTEINKMKK